MVKVIDRPPRYVRAEGCAGGKCRIDERPDFGNVCLIFGTLVERSERLLDIGNWAVTVLLEPEFKWPMMIFET